MRFLGDWKRKKDLQKKVNQAKEDQQVKQDSRQYTKLGLSQEDAEFLARKEIKGVEGKGKISKVFNALETVASKLEMPEQQPEKETKNKKQKQEQKKSIDSLVMDSFYMK